MIGISGATRFRAAGIHLGMSALVGSLAALLVFGLWYPGAYSQMAGGQNLFILIVSVDLILGPALTLVAFNAQKRKSLLTLDLSIIIFLQLAGLLYGLHTVFVARPVALVFEHNRFRIVSAVDVRVDELPKALPELQRLSITGPVYLGTREPKDSTEKLDSIDLAMQGIDIGQRPSFWQPYSASAGVVAANARSLSELYKSYPGSKQEIEKELKKKGQLVADMKFLPVIAREPNWSVLLDAKTGAVVDFIPYDGFL